MAKIYVMVVGSDHLHQLYNQQPSSDVFSPKKQAELAQVRAQLARFRPEVILIEAEPREQPQIDSLYALYKKGLLPLERLPTGRSERYQVGFALAKQLQLPSPKAVDYYASTSQSLLSTGTNIAAYTQDLKLLQTTARPLRTLVQHDSLSLYDYVALVNHPALVALVHRLQFNTPALVRNGTFAAGGTNTVVEVKLVEEIVHEREGIQPVNLQLIKHQGVERHRGIATGAKLDKGKHGLLKGRLRHKEVQRLAPLIEPHHQGTGKPYYPSLRASLGSINWFN